MSAQITGDQLHNNENGVKTSRNLLTVSGFRQGFHGQHGFQHQNTNFNIMLMIQKADISTNSTSEENPGNGTDEDMKHEL